MSTPKATKIALAAGLLVALAGLSAAAVRSLGGNLVYYWTPVELHAQGARGIGADVRLGGMVKAGSIVKKGDDSNDFSFVVKDAEAEVLVHATSMPPQMFREGIGVVVEGRMGSDGVFQSSRLLVKHDNQYRAPEDERHPDMEQLRKTLAESP